MKILGHVANGVVVLDGGARLPEGTPVIVSCDSASADKPKPKKRRVVLPLVKSDQPGSLHLTGEDIAKALDEEDLAGYSRFFKQAES